MTSFTNRHRLLKEKIVFRFRITIRKPLVILAFVSIVLVAVGYSLFVVGQHSGKKQLTKSTSDIEKIAKSVNPSLSSGTASIKATNTSRRIVSGSTLDVKKDSFKLTDKNKKQVLVSVDEKVVVLNADGKIVKFDSIKNSQKVTVIASVNPDNSLFAVQIYIQK